LALESELGLKLIRDTIIVRLTVMASLRFQVGMFCDCDIIQLKISEILKQTISGMYIV